MARVEKTTYETYDKPQGTTILELSDDKTVQIEFSEFSGKKYFNLRQFYKKDGRWCRGKGLSIEKKFARELIEELGDFLEKRGNYKR